MFGGLTTDQVLNANLQAEALLNMCPIPMPRTMATAIFLRRETVSRLGPDGYVIARVQFLPAYEVKLRGVTAEMCMDADKAMEMK